MNIGPLFDTLFYRTENALARVFTIVLLPIIIIFYIYLVVHAIRNPDMLLVADIHTEHLSFEVIDREKAAFFIRGFRVAERGKPGACEDGLVEPALKTKVTYGRVGEGPVEITLDSQSGSVDLIDRGDGKPKQFSNSVVMVEDESCRQPNGNSHDTFAAFSPMRFPVWGPAQIGKEFRPSAGFSPPEPGLLIDGKINVSAHAWCIGLLDGWFCSPSLYVVRTVTLPVASRLETPKATWWGVAYVDPQKTALVAAVATEAPVLNLYRPGRTAAEPILIPTLFQLTDDPTIFRFHITLLVLVAILALAGYLARHLHDMRSAAPAEADKPAPAEADKQ